jgi:SAM-dependent methyltransferase
VEREHWNRRYAGRELLWTATPNRFLVAEAEELSPGQALDLACGEGRNAVWLAQRGWAVTGVDFSEIALDKAQRLASAGEVAVRWVHADLREYRPEPQTYDLVLLFYLQVPEAERRAILRAAAAGVALRGTLLLVAHDRSNLERGYGGPREPAVLYTAGDVAGDLEGTGLRIERTALVERPVREGDAEHVALDVLVRATRPIGSANAARRDA